MDEITNNQKPKMTGLVKSKIIIAVIIAIMWFIIYYSIPAGRLLPGIFYLLYLFLIIVFFTLSIASLYTIIKKNSSLKGTLSTWLSMLIILFFLFSAYFLSRGILIHPSYHRCMINLYSLGVALEIYQNENEAKYPSEFKWCDLLI